MTNVLYAVCAFACSFVVLILPLRVFKKLDKTNRVERAFFFLIVWTCIFCLIDGCWGLFASKAIENDVLLFIFSSLFHLAASFTPVAWVFFVIAYVGNLKLDKFYLSLVIFAFVLEAVFLFINIFNKIIFDVDPDGFYVTGPYRKALFYIQFITYIMMAIICLIKILSSRSNGKFINASSIGYIYVLIFIISPIGAGIFQLVYADAPAYSIGYMLGCVVIYSFVVSDVLNKRFIEEAEKDKNDFYNGIINRFANHYESVFILNLYNSHVETIKSDKSLIARYGRHDNYAVTIFEYVAHDVLPIDRERMIQEIDPEYIKKRLESEKAYFVEFRDNIFGRSRWCRMNVASLSIHEALVGFSDVDEEVTKKLIDEKLVSDYASVFLVDLKTDSFKFIYRTNESGFADVSGGSYSETIQEYRSRVESEYQDEWRKIESVEGVQNYMKDADRREYVYPLSGVNKKWRRCVIYVVQREGDDVTRFIMTYLTLDDAAAETSRLSSQIAKQKTMLEEQQIQLEDALDKAESASQSKTRFLFNMSHDIRTPMNAIKGYTAMAKKHINDADKVDDCLNKIDIAGQNLLSLVNQVLDMSRIESGKIVLDNKPNNIIKNVQDLILIFKSTAESKDIKLTSSIENIKHPSILADTSRVNQIFINILGNAMKYTPSGGLVNFSVREISSSRPDYASFEFIVEDNGIGMSEQFLTTIFEPFSRENSSTVSKIEGTGLGMSIVKKMVDIMEGDINITSTLGKGTKIKIILSFKIIKQVIDSNSTNDIDLTIFKGKRLLVVEDNFMNREIFRDILSEYGFIIEEADDGDVALDIVKNKINKENPNYYALVFMDIQMPRMNGYEAAKAIRSYLDPLSINLPIVAMTANAFEEDRQNALDAGMDEHLAKPIEINKVLRVLAKYIK